jgi:hypothetical protein
MHASVLCEEIQSATRARELEAKLANEKLQHRATRKTNDHLRAELRAAEKRFEALQAIEGNEVRTRYRIRRTRKTSESVATCQLSDWHVEETVKASAVNGLNRYSLRVAEARINHLVENIVYLLKLHRHGTRIDTLVLQLLGDFMTGFIHDELIETNSLHPLQAVLWLHDKLSAVLRVLIEESRCRQIVAVCTVGNHGRSTEKRRIKTRVENSYEWLLYKMLAKHLPEIDWRIADGYFVYLPVFDAMWRHHHGDDLNYQGGVGGITIPVNKAIAQWDKTRWADYDWFGHWHQRVVMRKYQCNSSLIGYSEHALSIKAEFERPSQNFSLWEKDHGLTVTTPIFVE